MGRRTYGGPAAAVLVAGGCGQKTGSVTGESYGPPAKAIERPEAAEAVGMPAPTGESAHTIGEASAAAAIAAKVKIALTGEKGLDTGGLDVEAKPDGTVTLSGRAQSEEQKRRVEQAAMEVEGVSAVENSLTLAP